MPRITLDDSMMDVMIKMGEGNIGAITVLINIMEQSENIDPDNLLGGYGACLFLDTHGIYGSSIWIFYKDVCGESLTNMLAIVRGIQLGLIPNTTIEDHVLTGSYRGKMYGDFTGLIESVRKIVPNFGMN